MLKISNGPKFSDSIVLATARDRKVNRAKHSDLTSLLSLWNSLASFNLHFFLAVFLLSSSHKHKTYSSCLLMVLAVSPNKRYHNPDWILCSKYLGSNLDLDLPGEASNKVRSGHESTSGPVYNSTMIGSAWFQFVGRPSIYHLTDMVQRHLTRI